MPIVPLDSRGSVAGGLPLDLSQILGLIVFVIASFEFPWTNVEQFGLWTLNSGVIETVIEFSSVVLAGNDFLLGPRWFYFRQVNGFIEVLSLK